MTYLVIGDVAYFRILIVSSQLLLPDKHYKRLWLHKQKRSSRLYVGKGPDFAQLIYCIGINLILLCNTSCALKCATIHNQSNRFPWLSGVVVALALQFCRQKTLRHN